MGVVEIEFTKPYFAHVLHVLLTSAQIPAPTLDGLPPGQLITRLEWQAATEIGIGVAAAGHVIPAWALGVSAPVKVHHISIAELEADLAADPSAGAVTSVVVWLRVSVTGARLDIDAYRIDVDGAPPQTVMMPLWREQLPVEDEIEILNGAVLYAGSPREEVVTIRLRTDVFTDVLAAPANRVNTRSAHFLVRVSGEAIAEVLRGALEANLANLDPETRVEDPLRVAWMVAPWWNADLGWRAAGNFGILRTNACPDFFGDTDLSVGIQAVLALAPPPVPLPVPPADQIGLRLWLNTDVSDWDVFRCWAGSGGLFSFLLGTEAGGDVFGPSAGLLRTLAVGFFDGLSSLLAIGSLVGGKVRDALGDQPVEDWTAGPVTDEGVVLSRSIPVPNPDNTEVTGIEVGQDGLIVFGVFGFMPGAVHEPEFAPPAGPLPVLWLNGELNCDTGQWEPQFRVLRSVEISDEARVAGRLLRVLPVQVFGTSTVVPADTFTPTWTSSQDVPGTPIVPATFAVKPTSALAGPVSSRIYLHTSAGLRRYTITADAAPTPSPNQLTQEQIRCSQNKIRSDRQAGTPARPRLAAELVHLGQLHSRLYQWAEAGKAFTEAAGIYGQLGNVGDQVEALTYAANATSHLGRHDEALTLAQEAVDAARAGDDDVSLAEAHVQKATSLVMAERWLESGQVFGQAAEVFGDVGDVGRQVDCLLSAANAISHAGRHDEALNVAQEALDLASASGDDARLAEARMQKATSLVMAERWLESGQVFGQAAQVFGDVGDVGRQVDCLTSAANAFSHAGRHHDAIGTAQQAVAVAEQTGDPGMIAKAEETLALVLATAGQ